MAIPNSTQTNANDIQARCRQAFERGRRLYAIKGLWPLIPLLIVAYIAGHTAPSMILLLGTSLGLSGAWLRWRGISFAKAWYPGLLAGSITLVLPLAVRTIEPLQAHCTVGPGSKFCISVCTIGGLLAGAYLGSRATRVTSSTRFLLSTGWVSLLTGLLGCNIAGYAGLTGLMIGLFCTALPVLWISHSRVAR